MKNPFPIFILVLFASGLIAQVPQGINYQAIIRDANGQPKPNSNVDIQFSILKGANLVEEYSEVHNLQTNSSGLLTAIIGQGNTTLGSFATINWTDDVKFLKVEVNNQLIGITQMMSVPYAMFAARASLVAGVGIAVNDNEIINTGDVSNSNELQTLNLVGNTLSISNGNSIDLPNAPSYIAGAGISIVNNVIVANDASSTNELQNLSISGNLLSISNGNSVALPSAPTYSAGSGLLLNNNEFSAVDASNTNEFQNLNVSGNQLSISNGNTVTLPSAPTYTAGQGISINNQSISATDSSPTNELQSILMNGNDITLSQGGGTITLPSEVDGSITNELQTLALNSNVLSISNGNSISLPIQDTCKWSSAGNDVFYNKGRVLIGSSSPVHPYGGSLLQVISTSYESGVHLYGINGGSNYNNFTMRDYNTQSGWSWAHKAASGIDHQLSLEYLDGVNNIQNYKCFKITPSGNSGFGLDYNDTPPSRVSVKNGDVYIMDINGGLIMKSPNGNCWRITVSNSGQFTATAISCP